MHYTHTHTQEHSFENFSGTFGLHFHITFYTGTWSFHYFFTIIGNGTYFTL